MTSRPRGLAANASLALAGDALAKAGMFVALLVLAHAMTVAQYARLGIGMAAMLIATSALDGGVGIVTTREGAADPAARRPLLRAGMSARLPLAAAAAVILAGAGVAADDLPLALVVLTAAIVNAAQLALFATFRSTQNLLFEAVAKGFCGVVYPVVCLAVAAAGQRSASAAMLALVLPPLLTLPVLFAGARSPVDPCAGCVAPRPLLRRSLPFGLVAVATLVYYRAPMLLMGPLASHAATASYSVAANLGFGMLMLPAAVATVLLPKLSAEHDASVRVRLVRRALVWTTGLVVVANLAVGSVSFWLVPWLYGPVYRGAVGPLLILLASGVVIAAAGVVGTALIAMSRQREIVSQVLIAVAVNVMAAVVLIPALAAQGAALATLVTEVVSLAILVRAFIRCVGRAAVAPSRPGRSPEAVAVS
jgi:O-antigen/teichoic acid export membrane protein